MTIQTSTLNVATLKRVKNSVIGNPSAKLLLAQDELFVATSVIRHSSMFQLTYLFQPCQVSKRTGTVRARCGITGRYSY
jgi:hypothetical protein